MLLPLQRAYLIEDEFERVNSTVRGSMAGELQCGLIGSADAT